MISLIFILLHKEKLIADRFRIDIHLDISLSLPFFAHCVAQSCKMHCINTFIDIFR